ncbi:peptidylprolyl isomerase [Methanobacterium sp. CWC-01]|jgi:FKBP-type peptidyl-prolyl cis-trans isomerase SlyD|uniref:peptidylprolyl isomerase n=1 Tax=Methanobacterium aridiramus TaxID=2584467 RepID=UPI0025762F6B|nr:peptidylprolyl isomerase [Methanobacterium sp. CWC-01]WJI09783.1 peptidylprolyl isomerase [Methanobacterium sp. CWC-01]
MPVKKGDFIRLDYTGRIQETNEVFDTTNQEVAEKEEIITEGKAYGAIPIVVGGGHILPALDDAVEGMEAGEEKNVDVSPEDGFGKRDSNLLQMVPMREFKKQGIKPQVGMAITSEGHTGIIRTVSGGRVTVDFNHELAGKNLEYQVKVEEIIEDDTEKVKAMIQLHYPNPNLDPEKHTVLVEDGKVVIYMDEMAKFDQQRSYMDITLARFRIARDIHENMDNVSKVEFVDVFEKKEEVEEEEEVPEKLPEEEVVEEKLPEETLPEEAEE